MANEQFKIEGMSEIQAALKDLPVQLQAKVLRSFINKVGRKFIVEPLKTVLNYSSDLEKSIKVVGDRQDKLAISAGVTSSGYKLRWVDLGTKVRTTKKGYNRGQIIGKNQIQPLIESQIEPIIEYTQTEMGNEINKILERRLKKLRKG